MTLDPERVRQLELHVARLEEQLHASRDALRLQAQEYERRLTALNNIHERVTVTADRFEKHVAAEEKRYEVLLVEVNRRITRPEAVGAFVSLGVIAGLVVEFLR